MARSIFPDMFKEKVEVTKIKPYTKQTPNWKEASSKAIHN